MRPGITAEKLTILLVSIAWSTMPLLAHAEKGFWAVDQVPHAPADLARLAKSVLMVEVPAGRDVEIDLTKYPSVDLALTSFKDHAELTHPENILRTRLLTRCSAAKASVCRVPSTFELGTIFPVGDTDSFVSAYHVFRGAIRGRSDARVDMILRDAAGKIVFGETDADRARLAFAAPEALASRGTTPHAYDIVVLKTSRPLAGIVPLPISDEERTGAGALIFNVGFPGRTHDRASKLGRFDSDGVSQYVTFGRVLDRDEALRRNGKDPGRVARNVLARFEKAIMTTDADSYFGMSGGPTFNARGEVVGIVDGVYPSDGSADARSEQFSIRAAWVKVLLRSESAR